MWPLLRSTILLSHCRINRTPQMKERLNAEFSDVTTEYVLVQAWKKTANHIRQHNWYADTLGLDYESLRLPKFLASIREELQGSAAFTP